MKMTNEYYQTTERIILFKEDVPCKNCNVRSEEKANFCGIGKCIKIEDEYKQNDGKYK